MVTVAHLDASPVRGSPAGTLGRVRPALLLAAATLLGTGLVAGCSSDGSETDARLVDSVEAPVQGACRVLEPDDVDQPSNASPVVDCAQPHTAETYAVGEVPAELADAGWDSEALGSWAYATCSGQFQQFLGADESTVMRTIVSWAWFRPSEKAWADGARWYRCDIVGGGEQSEAYVDLPTTAAGLLADRPDDAWMACVDGASVEASPKVPCTEPHNWRAVTTIKVGQPEDPYPGDRAVARTTEDYCYNSVAAWLGYPKEFDYGFTWFHQPEWDAGNRRSICWAATSG